MVGCASEEAEWGGASVGLAETLNRAPFSLFSPTSVTLPMSSEVCFPTPFPECRCL